MKPMKTIWLTFDLSNGDPSGNGLKAYVWWFRTRKAAMKHRRRQHRMYCGAKLSMPRKATVAP